MGAFRNALSRFGSRKVNGGTTFNGPVTGQLTPAVRYPQSSTSNPDSLTTANANASAISHLAGAVPTNAMGTPNL